MRFHLPAASRAACNAAMLGACVMLSGCYVKVHGVQSTGGGGTATAASGQAAGSAKFAGGRAALSSGRAAAHPGGGGHVTLNGGAVAVLVVGLVVADLVSYLRGPAGLRPLPESERILETCSCFQKPGNGE